MLLACCFGPSSRASISDGELQGGETPVSRKALAPRQAHTPREEKEVDSKESAGGVAADKQIVQMLCEVSSPNGEDNLFQVNK